MLHLDINKTKYIKIFNKFVIKLLIKQKY